MKPKHRLTKLRVKEISLVDRPANPFSEIIFTKRANEREVNEEMRRQEVLEKEVRRMLTATKDDDVWQECV